MGENRDVEELPDKDGQLVDAKQELPNLEERRAEILERIKNLEEVRQQRSPLVLTERTAHLDLLSERLSASVKNALVLKGGMGKKQREHSAQMLASIPEDEERVIVATGRYLGEGFDDARLDTLFLTLPVSWRGVVSQYAGRLHRLHHVKRDVIIYDYADLNIGMLVNMYKRRLRGYRAIGYEIVEHSDSQMPTASHERKGRKKMQSS